MRKNSLAALGAATILASALAMSGCTQSTGEAGQMSYFTEGVITDIEVIDVSKNRYDSTTNTGVGAAVGAIAGQAIGKDTKGTLIGAGIGAILGFFGNHALDNGEGMRLTVNTDNGLVLIDQPYSCLFKINSKVRLINRSGKYQLQVYDGKNYHTAVAQSSSDCPLNK